MENNLTVETGFNPVGYNFFDDFIQWGEELYDDLFSDYPDTQNNTVQQPKAGVNIGLLVAGGLALYLILKK